MPPTTPPIMSSARASIGGVEELFVLDAILVSVASDVVVAAAIVLAGLMEMLVGEGMAVDSVLSSKESTLASHQ